MEREYILGVDLGSLSKVATTWLITAELKSLLKSHVRPRARHSCRPGRIKPTLDFVGRHRGFRSYEESTIIL